MYIEYNGQNLVFRFEHQAQPTDAEGKQQKRFTGCTVTTKEGDFVAAGYARVHPKDANFNREKGRQISFGKALQEFVPKEDRLKFWQAYQNWKSATPRMILSTDSTAVRA